MHRRRLLALCGLCATAGAGCVTDLAASSDDEPENSPDGGPTGTPTGDGGTGTPDDGVTVENIGVRKAVRYDSIMGSGGVLAGDDRQYVVASVRSSQELSASAFSFETDSQSWSPGLPDTAGATNVSVAGREGGAVGENVTRDRGGYIAFTVPSPLSASNPRIRFRGDGSEWSLPADESDRLAAPAARFELDALDVPEQVDQGESLAVSLSATNVSETDGRFLAAVYWPTTHIADDDESHVVERDVAAGEQVTADFGLDTAYTDGRGEPVTLRVRGHVAAERDVEVRGDSTPY